MTVNFTLKEVHALDEHINEMIKTYTDDDYYRKERIFWESIREKVWEHCK
jgi:hypothetical protein